MMEVVCAIIINVRGKRDLQYTRIITLHAESVLYIRTLTKICSIIPIDIAAMLAGGIIAIYKFLPKDVHSSQLNSHNNNCA